jgi:hypothetical protein
VDTFYDRRRQARERGEGLSDSSTLNNVQVGEAQATQAKGEASVDVGNGSFEVGEWFTLTDKDEVLDESMIPFFGDNMVNLPDLLPKDMRGGY